MTEAFKISQRAGAVLAAAAAALLLSACAPATQVERWRMTDRVAAGSGGSGVTFPAAAVRTVFFREAGTSAKAAQPINLYLDGHYQASLVGDTYTEQSLCPGARRIAVHFNDVERRYVTKNQGALVQVGTEAVQYFRVAEDATGQAVVHPVAPAAAQGVSSLRLLQSHTVPRVAPANCTRA